MLLLILSGLVTVVFYLWVKKKQSYFRERGLPYVEPTFLLGNVAGALVGRESLGAAYGRIHRHAHPHPIVGAFQLLQPVWVACRPELVYEITVKQFSHFEDHPISVDERNPLECHLFSMRGGKWRALRNKILPAFTTGKLRGMLPSMHRAADELIGLLEAECAPRGETDADARDLMVRYTIDVVGSCAFGFQPTALKDPDCELRRMGKRVFQPSPRQLLAYVLRSLYPDIISYLHIKTYPQDLEDYFFGIFGAAFEHRRRTGQSRKDFVQILLELKDKGGIEVDPRDKQEVELLAESSETLEITDKLLMAQAFLFFNAGYDTTATTLGYTLYHLACHPECQRKVRREIEDAKKRRGGAIDFEALKNLNYLEACIYEAQRLNPPVEFLFKKCTKACGLDGGKYPVEEGMMVMIPLKAIHHDPGNFPDPEVFRPERFLVGDNMDGKFLTFGEGPRMCIGRRFATMVSKLCLARVLECFNVEKSVRLKEPIRTFRYSFIAIPVDGIWLKFSRITEEGHDTFQDQ